jgi:hypothetical protein
MVCEHGGYSILNGSARGVGGRPGSTERAGLPLHDVGDERLDAAGLADDDGGDG